MSKPHATPIFTSRWLPTETKTVVIKRHFKPGQRRGRERKQLVKVYYCEVETHSLYRFANSYLFAAGLLEKLGVSVPPAADAIDALRFAMGKF